MLLARFRIRARQVGSHSARQARSFPRCRVPFTEGDRPEPDTPTSIGVPPSRRHSPEQRRCSAWPSRSSDRGSADYGVAKGPGCRTWTSDSSLRLNGPATARANQRCTRRFGEDVGESDQPSIGPASARPEWHRDDAADSRDRGSNAAGLIEADRRSRDCRPLRPRLAEVLSYGRDGAPYSVLRHPSGTEGQPPRLAPDAVVTRGSWSNEGEPYSERPDGIQSVCRHWRVSRAAVRGST